MEKDTPLLSIIMPCFNHGRFLQEALDSIQQDKVPHALEVIIVDDGSTDARTLSKLEELKQQGVVVLHQKNAGPAAARNTAIQNASGKYILPLDADNKLTPEYINKGISILEEGKYQVVYCTPLFFGDAAARTFTSFPFDINELLAANYIDNCALFTKEVWVKNNGYDTRIPYWGHEDWEFWINAYANGFSFYFIPEKLFYYRVVEASVATQFKDKQKQQDNHQYIIQKHYQLYLGQFLKLNYIRKKYKTDITRFIVAPFIFLGYLLHMVKTPFQKAEEKFGKKD
ncbi:MAG: glycosyltransferase family 2 protein [Bacteroidetes bacterium]|nr:glycosyltransferase family 2 protein [Bacteroidota bacterium]